MEGGGGRGRERGNARASVAVVPFTGAPSPRRLDRTCGDISVYTRVCEMPWGERSPSLLPPADWRRGGGLPTRRGRWRTPQARAARPRAIKSASRLSAQSMPRGRLPWLASREPMRGVMPCPSPQGGRHILRVHGNGFLCPQDRETHNVDSRDNTRPGELGRGLQGHQQSGVCIFLHILHLTFMLTYRAYFCI